MRHVKLRPGRHIIATDLEPARHFEEDVWRIRRLAGPRRGLRALHDEADLVRIEDKIEICLEPAKLRRIWRFGPRPAHGVDLLANRPGLRPAIVIATGSSLDL